MPLPSKPFVLKLCFSNRYALAQILRTSDGHIVAAAGSIEKALRTSLDKTANKQASAKVGQLLADRAKEALIPSVHWDRKHGQKYHGKIKALLEAMKGQGLPLC